MFALLGFKENRKFLKRLKKKKKKKKKTMQTSSISRPLPFQGLRQIPDGAPFLG